ncbi:hypothetical protein Purlil1_3786 [Purpureocillium lilacinum]|uniref:Secreted protein n=1 Tax=Purpureocillium lilacinum TaxID=33203 RepID=A0ABR0C6V9_PURLI|nr:hypothetical protein Purlil1_3786 [Purpureocillium lilacinum]
MMRHRIGTWTVAALGGGLSREGAANLTRAVRAATSVRRTGGLLWCTLSNPLVIGLQLPASSRLTDGWDGLDGTEGGVRRARAAVKATVVGRPPLLQRHQQQQQSSDGLPDASDAPGHLELT